MVTVMKRFMFMVAALMVMAVPAMADDDKPISIEKMPVAAQEFMTKYFSGKNVAVAKQEGIFMGRNYDVIFTDGDKVEFDRNGRWTNVDCKYGAVPKGIVPEKIDAYVEKHFPGADVRKIEKEDRRYELELSNDVDLKFNFSFELVDVDF